MTYLVGGALSKLLPLLLLHASDSALFFLQRPQHPTGFCISLELISVLLILFLRLQHINLFKNDCFPVSSSVSLVDDCNAALELVTASASV